MTAKSIGVVDTTLRDAHQCLWATRMTTAHMLPIADMMDNIGFERIDIDPIAFGEFIPAEAQPVENAVLIGVEHAQQHFLVVAHQEDRIG